MNDKPHYVQVKGAELDAIRAAGNGLDVPMLHKYSGHENAYYVDADELRAWRASAPTSDGEPR